jgi:putative FmdB family regulatory protein
MPIYAYKCATCGHAEDVMQKMSDAPRTTCPACGAETFSKQVTAPNFALKGSGWYVTDFRDGKKPDAGKVDAAKPDADTSKEVSGDSKSAGSEVATKEAKPEAKSTAEADSATPATAAPPASTPASKTPQPASSSPKPT